MPLQRISSRLLECCPDAWDSLTTKCEKVRSNHTNLVAYYLDLLSLRIGFRHQAKSFQAKPQLTRVCNTCFGHFCLTKSISEQALLFLGLGFKLSTMRIEKTMQTVQLSPAFASLLDIVNPYLSVVL
jgi:hypothetical protein